MLKPRARSLTLAELTVLIALFGAFGIPRHALSIENRTQPSNAESGSVFPVGRFGFQVTPELEGRIIDLFSEQKCEDVRRLVSHRDLGGFRPKVIAAIAYCEPPGEDPEALFERAEARDPKSATLVMIHARYRWRKDPASAEPLWRKVLGLTENPALRAMAEDYLAGKGDDSQAVPLTRNWVFSAALSIGASRESNPAQFSFSDPDSLANEANVFNLSLSGSAERLTGYGSFGSTYAMTSNRYARVTSVDFLQNDLEVPVLFHVGSREDLVLKPYASFATLGNLAYQATVGAGVQGVAYRGELQESLQASVFHDRLFQGITPGFSTGAEQGLHFRLENGWDFRFPRTYLRATVHLEHVRADRDSMSEADSPIRYSHTDLGLSAVFEYDLKFLSLGFRPSLLVREDQQPSTSGPTVGKRREDVQLVLQPNATFPLMPGVQLFVWYEWNRTFSNLGADDYVDRNNLNQTVGAAFRFFVSSL